MGKLFDRLAHCWPLPGLRPDVAEAQRQADWRLRGVRLVRSDGRPRASEPRVLDRYDHFSFASWSRVTEEDLVRLNQNHRAAQEDLMVRTVNQLSERLLATQEAELEYFMMSGAMPRDLHLEVGPVVMRTEDGPRYFDRTYHLGQHWRIV